MKGKHFIALLALAFLCHAQAVAKGLSKDAILKVEERYQNSAGNTSGFREKKTVLVLERTGIPAIGGAFSFLALPNWEEVDIRGKEITDRPTFAEAMTQLEVGTLLAILQKRFKNNRVELWCATITKYPVKRVSAFRTETNSESVYVKFRFFFDKSVLEDDDLETIFRTIDWWVKPFQTEKKAKAYRNTLITVPEIKLGMTIADVESIFGIPSRKATLDDKVIYKYKDMTVDFVDGKVSDVKF